MNFKNKPQRFIVTVFTAGIVAITAILSKYDGKVAVTVGSGGLQFQIESSTYRK